MVRLGRARTVFLGRWAFPIRCAPALLCLCCRAGFSVHCAVAVIRLWCAEDGGKTMETSFQRPAARTWGPAVEMKYNLVLAVGAGGVEARFDVTDRSLANLAGSASSDSSLHPGSSSQGEQGKGQGGLEEGGGVRTRNGRVAATMQVPVSVFLACSLFFASHAPHIRDGGD
ncbi:hypothetical protein LY76DRAFT_586233, partial [Colletotrichum caudatum]